MDLLQGEGRPDYPGECEIFWGDERLVVAEMRGYVHFVNLFTVGAESSPAVESWS